MSLPKGWWKNRRGKASLWGLAGVVFLGLLLHLTLARAGDVLQNGSFETDLSGWIATDGLAPSWQAGGYDGPVAHAGESIPGQGGYLRLETAPGAGQAVSGYVYQNFTVPEDGSRVTLSLAWAKSAAGAEPARQVAEVRVLSPQGLAWEWRDSTVASVYSEVYGLEWNLLEEQGFVAGAAGTYQLELAVEMENGDAADARAAIAFDEVHVSVAVPDRTPPAAPQGLAVRDPRTGGSLRLSWSANREPDLAGYAVYRAEAETGPFRRVSAGLVAANGFTDSGLTDGTTYYYYVTALDDSGNESSPSQRAAGIPTHDTTPPATPKGFRVWDAATGNRLELSWTANREEDLAGYLLYRAEKRDGPFQPVFAEPYTSTFYVDTSVRNDVPYYYYLVAVDTVGNASPPTLVLSAVPTLDTTPPAPPAEFRVENPGTGTELNLFWRPNREPDLEGYYVYRRGPGAGGWERIAALRPEEGGSYTDASVQRGQEYRYRLAAFDRVGNVSDPTAELAVVAEDFIPPAAPVGLELQDPWSGSELQVSWAANQEEDLAGYNLYRGGSPEGPWKKVNRELLTGVAYMDRGLRQGQLYHYRVTAVDTTGNESDPSAAAEGKPYVGTAVSVFNPQGAVPGSLRLEQSSTSIFLEGELTAVDFSAVAEDVYGAEVPVSGVWWFATDRGRFAQVEVLAPSGARGTLGGESPGEASVIVQFVPQQAGAPPVRATGAVRVLDWEVRLEVSARDTYAGSREVELLARLTGAGGDPVSDAGARVAFAVEQLPGQEGRQRGEEHVGRFVEKGRALARNRAGLTLAAEGVPGADGLVRGVLAASTVPGRNRVRAVLKYQDPLRGAGPALVATSGAEEVSVRPGPAAYVGWRPAAQAVQAGREYTASLHAFDAFGNATGDDGGLRVSIQSPPWGKADFSLDGGKTWVTDDDWHPVSLGSQVRMRVPGAGGPRRGQYAYLLVRIDDAGDAVLAPPPGVSQVNVPLVLQIR